MSRVHFVGGEKGGVGKSVLARVLCQWCLDRAVPWAALDADPAQGKLLSGYGERCHAVDLSAFESIDQIMDRALAAQRDVLVDLPAQSQAPLARWLRESDVFGLAEKMAVRLSFWYVTDGGFASVNTLEKLVRELPGTADIVVVCNRRWAEDFSHLDDSKLARQLLARGGRFVDLPALDPPLMHKVEGRGVSLGQLLTETHDAPGALSRMERQRLTHWLTRAHAELAPAMTTAATESSATEPAATEHSAAEPAPAPRHSLPQPGTTLNDGARTWTEFGKGYKIHHVRY